MTIAATAPIRFIGSLPKAEGAEIRCGPGRHHWHPWHDFWLDQSTAPLACFSSRARSSSLIR